MTHAIMHSLSLDGKKYKSISDVCKIVNHFDDLVLIDYNKLINGENPVVYEYHLSYYFNGCKFYETTHTGDDYVKISYGVASELYRHRKALNDALCNPKSNYGFTSPDDKNPSRKAEGIRQDVPSYDKEGNRI